MNFIKKIVWLLLVAFLIAGCIREDMDDCKNVAVFFRYDADGQVDVLKQYIDQDRPVYLRRKPPAGEDHRLRSG